jgi:hypothetical protein
MSALAQEGIYCNPGQNDVQAGIGQPDPDGARPVLGEP